MQTNKTKDYHVRITSNFVVVWEQWFKIIKYKAYNYFDYEYNYESYKNNESNYTK